MNTAELWVSFVENPTADLKKQIALSYLNLVHYVVKTSNLYQSGLFDRRDFFQFGVEGLSEAIDRFNPDYGTKFETYAIQRIRGKIFDELRKYNKKPEDVSLVSLNESVEGDTDLEEIIGDKNDGPDIALEKKQQKEKIRELIEKLRPRERAILTFYFYEDLTYEEISGLFNDITVSRVSQVIDRVMRKMRANLSEFY